MQSCSPEPGTSPPCPAPSRPAGSVRGHTATTNTNDAAMKHRRNRKVSAFSEHYPATHTVTQHPKLVTRIPNGRTLLFSASASSNGVVGYSTSQKSLEAMVQAAVDKVLSSKSGDISGDRDIMIELLIFDILSLKPILTKYIYL